MIVRMSDLSLEELTPLLDDGCPAKADNMAQTEMPIASAEASAEV
jgi:hypothetical protein